MAIQDFATREEMIANLLASPPPRTVPQTLQKLVMKEEAGAGVLGMGLAVWAIGMVFMYFLFPWNFRQDWALEKADAVQVPGKVTAVTKTDVSIGGGRHTPGVPVMAYTFEFLATQGKTVSAVCYTTGTYWHAGQVVPVRYRPENPEVASITGARRSEEDTASGLGVTILPLVGLGVVGAYFTTRRSARNLLVHGRVTQAQVTEMTRIRTKSNKSLYAITLESADWPAPVTVRKYREGILTLARARMVEKAPVTVLYRPGRPKQILFPEVF